MRLLHTSYCLFALLSRYLGTKKGFWTGTFIQQSQQTAMQQGKTDFSNEYNCHFVFHEF